MKGCMRGDGSMGWTANWGSSRVSPSTTFSNVIMEQTSPSPNTMMLMHRLKAWDEVYLGRRTHRGAPPWNWWDIKWGAGLWYLGCQGGHPWYWGYWGGTDGISGQELPAVCGIQQAPTGAGSRGPRLISAFQGLGITLSPSRWHLSRALVNLIQSLFAELKKTKPLLLLIEQVVTFLQRLQHPVKASMVVKLSDKWFSDFFHLKAPPIYITLCYCKHHAIRMMHCVTSFCNKLLVCVTNGM